MNIDHLQIVEVINVTNCHDMLQGNQEKKTTEKQNQVLSNDIRSISLGFKTILSSFAAVNPD